MKVLVTGANGLLGSHIVRELLNRKFDVRAMVRKGSNLEALKGLNCEFFKGRITNKTDVEKAVKDCDYAIHAAARTTQTPSQLEAFYKINVQSTKLLFEACVKYKITRFVFVSTANCFGNGTKVFPGNEKNPFPLWLKSSGYAYSKLLAQEMVLNKSGQYELDTVVVNPTFLIGENDVKPSSGEIFFHVVNKRFVFYPPGGKNFVDAKSVAGGVVNAMLKGKKRESYLLAGENLSYVDFFKTVMRITQQNPLLIPVPSWFLKLLGYGGDLLEKWFKVPVQLTSTNAKMICTGNYYSAEKAIKEIDFEVIPLQQSLEKAILWFQKNN
ncbi:NAD-dependent epimerase/dehydratase family protein [Maribellus comscasis]|uniref:NAD-dependent epimerase/dehydratase family protein n=1 Tax=Maribellus comscasis TaxID=2681766 RepID=A0A6I6JU23_9BACT|nr:NAD-dependent epimerase/dehydratase family protein [Maribellus comscasis]QGY44538.1 NAD-dependent epimerase/dehydratase family protein [Maribellus comscasis]